jgi:hypothetical protein
MCQERVARRINVSHASESLYYDASAVLSGGAARDTKHEPEANDQTGVW